MSEETSAAIIKEMGKRDRVKKAKQDVSNILQTITNDTQGKYWYECRYIRWGLIEKDLHAIIDELETS